MNEENDFDRWIIYTKQIWLHYDRDAFPGSRMAVFEADLKSWHSKAKYDPGGKSPSKKKNGKFV